MYKKQIEHIIYYQHSPLKYSTKSAYVKHEDNAHSKNTLRNLCMSSSRTLHTSRDHKAILNNINTNPGRKNFDPKNCGELN